MFKVYGDDEVAQCLSNVRAAVNSSGLWMEVPLALAERFNGPFVGAYTRTDKHHEFTLWRCLENGTNNWSNQLYHGDKRQIAVKRGNISGMPADLTNVTTGAPHTVELETVDDGRGEVLRVRALLSGFRDDRKQPTGRDFRTQVVHVTHSEYLRLHAGPQPTAGQLFVATFTLAVRDATQPTGYALTPQKLCYPAESAEQARTQLDDVVARKFGPGNVLDPEFASMELVA